MKLHALLLAATIMLAGVGHAVAAPAPPGPDRAYIDAVLDGMVESGTITQDQADRIKTRGQTAADTAAAAKPAPKKSWFDIVKINGYVQGRFQAYPDGLSVKDANGTAHSTHNEFVVRRARIGIEANPTAHTKIFLQPDFGQNTVVMKDAWVEQSFGPHVENRLRLGEQNVPFGFETDQSSGAMLPLERNWTTRRFIPDELDTGLVYYYTTAQDRATFTEGKNQLAPGDYGNLAIGVFNGQGMGPEAQEVDSDKHIALRLTKPFILTANGAYAEIGASYYGGDYYSKGAKTQFSEHLLGFHGYIAPKPFGIQTEYFDGKTEGHDLRGWYAMGLWQATPEGTAFVRYDKVDGWRKGANSEYSRHRTSIGYAHQIDANYRITAEYDIENLDTEDGGRNDVFGLQVMGKF